MRSEQDHATSAVSHGLTVLSAENLRCGGVLPPQVTRPRRCVSALPTRPFLVCSQPSLPPIRRRHAARLQDEHCQRVRPQLGGAQELAAAAQGPSHHRARHHAGVLQHGGRAPGVQLERLCLGCPRPSRLPIVLPDPKTVTQRDQVMAMTNTSSSPASREFLALFVIDPMHPVRHTTSAFGGQWLP